LKGPYVGTPIVSHVRYMFIILGRCYDTFIRATAVKRRMLNPTGRRFHRNGIWPFTGSSVTFYHHMCAENGHVPFPPRSQMFWGFVADWHSVRWFEDYNPVPCIDVCLRLRV
jgi:hypothetical protein